MTEETFVDAESYTGSGNMDKISFQLIVLWHVRKIMDLTTQEWHGGCWIDKTISTKGNMSATQPVYIPNTRESFINAVKGLYDLLHPYFDKTMQTASASYLRDYDEAYEKWQKVENTSENAEKWKSFKLDIHRELFRHLSAFLKREQYFGQRMLED